VDRKVVIVMVLMTGSISGKFDFWSISAAGEERCDRQHSLTLFRKRLIPWQNFARVRDFRELWRTLHAGCGSGIATTSNMPVTGSGKTAPVSS